MTDLEKLLLGALGFGIVSIGSLIGWLIKGAFPKVIDVISLVATAIDGIKLGMVGVETRSAAKLDQIGGKVDTLTGDFADLKAEVSRRLSSTEGELVETRVELARSGFVSQPEITEATPAAQRTPTGRFQAVRGVPPAGRPVAQTLPEGRGAGGQG